MWTEVCRRKSVDGSLWTNFCGRKSVDGSRGIVAGSDFKCSLSPFRQSLLLDRSCGAQNEK